MSNTSEDKMNSGPTRVAIRLVFLRVGELKTESEKFHAHIAVEARWSMESGEKEMQLLSSLSSDDLDRFQKGETVKLPDDFSEKNWTPKLFLLNVSRDRDEERSYNMKLYREHVQLYEFLDIHGHFYSSFDLHDFPSDIQELSVSVGSALFSTDVILETDSRRASGINHEAFIDEQEWSLYDHVETRSKFLKGFLFQNDGEEKLDDPDHEQKRSVLTIFCHAARRSTYFNYNGYILILLITMTAFTAFAIPPNTTRSRLSLTCTILLTSIAFRWTISNNLPKICYLTAIDRYALSSIFVLIGLCIWHAIVGTIIFTNGYDENLTSSSQWTWIDRYVLAAIFSLYVLIHIIMIIRHWRGPIAKRKEMAKRDDQYHRLVKEMESKDKERRTNSTDNTKEYRSHRYIP